MAAAADGAGGGAVRGARAGYPAIASPKAVLSPSGILYEMPRESHASFLVTVESAPEPSA